MNTDVSKLTEIFFRILLCLFGILGNLSLLFFTIPKVNRRIEPFKILLINLAFSNLLTNCMVDIPGILVEIYGTWFLGDMYCKIFWFTASVLITNSILTTLSMSIFWFQKLVGNRPINSNAVRSAELRHLRIFVSLGWLISVAFSVPFLFFCSVNMMKNDEKDQLKLNQSIFGCQDNFPSRSQKHVYGILYLVLANGLPVLGMFSTNVRIIIFLIRNRKQVSALKCLKTKTAMTSSVSKCGITKCRPSGGQAGKELVSCISSVSGGLEFVSAQIICTTSEDPVKDNIKNVEKGNLIKKVLTSWEGGSMGDEEHNPLPSSNICNPCNSKESAQITELCDFKATHFFLAAETGIICIDGKTYKTGDAYSTSSTCYQDQYIEGNTKDKLPELLKSLDSKVRLLAKTPTRYLSATTQIRAAISIMAVVGVFFIFWVTYLSLKILKDKNSSEEVIDTASLIAASYTTITPYVFIYSMKKCPCG